MSNLIFEHIDQYGDRITVVPSDIPGHIAITTTKRDKLYSRREVYVPRQELIDALTASTPESEPPAEVMPPTAPVTVHVTHGDVHIDDAALDTLADRIAARLAPTLSDAKMTAPAEQETDPWTPGTNISGRLHEHPRVWVKDRDGELYKPFKDDCWTRWITVNREFGEDGWWDEESFIAYSPMYVATEADLDAVGVPEDQR